jgi:hypothetical protein
MSFEAMGFRHVAVAVPAGGMRRSVAASLRQQSAQSQQRNVVHSQARQHRLQLALTATAEGMRCGQSRALAAPAQVLVV